MRSVLSVAAGGVVALVAYWGGAVLALLLLRGMPLGSTGGPPTGSELAIHLALGAVACFLGTALTVWMSRASPPLHAGVLALILGSGALVGFGKPASQWPSWFGFSMAAMCLLGGAAAAAWAMRRG